MRYPLTVEMEGRRLTCVGGGPVAAAKVVPMIRAGAVATVISPTCVEELASEATWQARPYVVGDLSGPAPPHLVVAATADPTVDDQVAAEADGRGIWCLRIDGRGSVVVPSVIRSGELLLSMSTGAPALTRRLRMHLEERLDDRWARASAVLSALRTDPAIRDALAAVSPQVRRQRWATAVDIALSGDGDDQGRARSTLTGNSGQRDTPTRAE